MLPCAPLVVGLVLVVSCGGSEQSPPRAPSLAGTPSDRGAPAEAPPRAAELEVTTAVRRTMPRGIACDDGDVCGFFLQVVSPGSDAEALAQRAVRVLDGKCTGQVIVYRDPRNVLGSGIVVRTAEEKRLCEEALGRPQDRDFPGTLVFRVAG